MSAKKRRNSAAQDGGQRPARQNAQGQEVKAIPQDKAPSVPEGR